MMAIIFVIFSILLSALSNDINCVQGKGHLIKNLAKAAVTISDWQKR